ncbi:glycoside hydrolase family 43 protein [Chitinophaga tropicalis]|uniref:Family 43 glycosylhydrolase n=1 Tax=Chitinophaga tropicalis TaxID=2683588 RepID=A0A7K1U2K8_9BACT|nr:glycoside hydrolase 43 family protein [Chitinophaga tropicalis]MVT08604.1 family 43 glycosylhydrolase [Chitinophaga tropicalis]
MKNILFPAAVLLFSLASSAQSVSKSWVPDLGNGSYKNPVINADYSDPDVCRAGNDFYLVSSSFNAAPGLPILHSKDLVNWTIIGHALKRQPPFEHFSKPRHGNGVWAPSIRYHGGEFYIYYPDPDFGIYMIKAKNAAGPWSDPVMVKEGKGLIDPCPLWDDDGSVYLVHAWAGSRAGIKSILTLNRMNKEGSAVTDEGVLVFDGHNAHPTLEGPKLYKRNGYYYIFAPAGGVSTGWQLVLRSKNIYGPYEEKIVMDQGKSPVNGPHQGAWVEMPDNSQWFLHFQDKGAYGRVVHLQPMQWVNNWPVIGTDKDGDGKGEPVLTYKKPLAGEKKSTPQESDEFEGNALGLQWQWQANPKATWSMTYPARGFLRLFSAQLPDSFRNSWDVPNILMQKFPADSFTITTKCSFSPNPSLEGERTGLIILGASYASLSLVKNGTNLQLVYASCKNADKGNKEEQQVLTNIQGNTCWFRVRVSPGAICHFAYSTDGNTFINAGTPFTAEPGRWVGAKAGIFCTRAEKINDSGFADYDWFRIE